MYYSRVSNNRTASIKRKEWKTRFHMACKEEHFDVVELMVNDQFKNFSINLNAQYVNGMTHTYVRLLDTLEYVQNGSHKEADV